MDEAQTVTATFSPIPPIAGDINGDWELNLVDIILALQVLTGIEDNTTDLSPEHAVGSLNRIGLADGVEVLNKLVNAP